MHPLLVITTLTTGLFAGVKLVRALRADSAARGHKARSKQAQRAQPRPMGELKRDPDTGVYHPHQD